MKEYLEEFKKNVNQCIQSLQLALTINQKKIHGIETMVGASKEGVGHDRSTRTDSDEMQLFIRSMEENCRSVTETKVVLDKISRQTNALVWNAALSVTRVRENESDFAGVVDAVRALAKHLEVSAFEINVLLTKTASDAVNAGEGCIKIANNMINLT